MTRLRGTDEDEHFKQTVRVTTQTRVVAGVTTTVVRDVVRRPDGTLAEKTDDWYAADEDGNVWYFGEDTATYDENGNLEDREGSWEAGVDGAVAGIIMPADPRPSHADYMEFAKGEAEDQAWVVQRLPYVVTPGGREEHIVRTLEWSRLEPDVVSMKFYARGLGIVEEKRHRRRRRALLAGVVLRRLRKDEVPSRNQQRVPVSLGSLVREGGVEPPRPFGHTDLNRARLPIPPLAPEAC